MLFPLKKFILATVYNSLLFVMLIIGVQNSNDKMKLNFLIQESVPLPTSFIIGVSFISGSILGFILPLNSMKRE